VTGFTDQSKNVQKKVVEPTPTPTPTPTPCDPNAEDEPATGQFGEAFEHSFNSFDPVVPPGTVGCPPGEDEPPGPLETQEN
jgi:hypothetical protein